MGGQLVRDTCTFIWHVENSDTPSPTQNRLESIERIFDSFKLTCSLEQFYTSQFTVLENGQLSPLNVSSYPRAGTSSDRPARAVSSTYRPIQGRSPQKPSAPSPGANIKNRAPAPSASSVEMGARKGASNLPVPRSVAPPPPSRESPTPTSSHSPLSPTRPPPAARPPPRGRGRGRGMGTGFAAARPEGSPQRGEGSGWLGSRNPQAAASSPARRQPSFGTQRRQPNEE